MYLKKYAFLFLFGFFTKNSFCQQNNFEGKIVYKVDIVSESEGITASAWKKSLLMGDSMTVTIKAGNYKRSCGPTDEYYIMKDEKAYIKFKNRDTLYYRPYNDDTTRVLAVKKTDESKEIAGFNCKGIVLKTSTTTQKFLYSPALYQNPDFDKNNTIGGYNVYAKETSSIWLEQQEDHTGSLLIDSKAVRVESGHVDDYVFDLPNLPVKKFSIESIYVPASYPGGLKSWVKYLQENLNTKLATKFVKLKKGEAFASQKVIVSFIVMENGELSNIKVINPDDVHPRLAEEAIRVITESGKWKTAEILNEKIIYHFVQPITFQVNRE